MNVEMVNATLTSARDIIEAQNAEISKLKEENSLMLGAASFLQRYALAVNAHNVKCDAECGEGVACGYEGYLKRTGRRCASCPAVFKVDVMPHKGSA
jgi:hypothetical protein